MRYLPPAFVTAAPAMAHPGTPDHDAGWFTVALGAFLIVASVFVLWGRL